MRLKLIKMTLLVIRDLFCEVYPKNYDFIDFFLNKVVSIFNLITINILLGY